MRDVIFFIYKKRKKSYLSITMSLINISAVGQSPDDFTITIPDGFTVPKNTQVCLVSYNGTTETNNLPTAVTVTADTDIINFLVAEEVNDMIAITRSNYDLTDTKGEWGMLGHEPFVATLNPGVYVTLRDLADELARALNEADTDSSFTGSGTKFGRDIGTGTPVVSYAMPGDGWYVDIGKIGTVPKLQIRQRRRTEWLDVGSSNYVCPPGIAGTQGGGTGAGPTYNTVGAGIQKDYYANSILPGSSVAPNWPSGQPGPWLNLEPNKMYNLRNYDYQGLSPPAWGEDPVYRVQNGFPWNECFAMSWEKPIYLSPTFNRNNPGNLPTRNGGLNRYGFEWQFGTLNQRMADPQWGGTEVANGGIFPGGTRAVRTAFTPLASPITPTPDWDFKNTTYMGTYNGVTVGLCPDSWGGFNGNVASFDWADDSSGRCTLPVSVQLVKPGAGGGASYWQFLAYGLDGELVYQESDPIKYDPTANSINISIVIDMEWNLPTKNALVFRAFISQTTGGPVTWKEFSIGGAGQFPGFPWYNDTIAIAPLTLSRGEDWFPVMKIHNPSGWGLPGGITEPPWGYGINGLGVQVNHMFKDAQNIGNLTGALSNSICNTSTVGGTNLLSGGRRIGSGFQILPPNFTAPNVQQLGTVSPQQYNYMTNAGWFDMIESQSVQSRSFLQSIGTYVSPLPINSALVKYETGESTTAGISCLAEQQIAGLGLTFTPSVSQIEPFYITTNIGNRSTGHLTTDVVSHPVQLLGMGLPNDNYTGRRFSARIPTSNWVDLNNAAPMVINRINTRLVTETNRAYQQLAEFNMVLRFRQKSKTEELDL